MLRRRRVQCWLSIPLIVLGVSACASGSDALPAGIDVSPIVVDLAERSVPSTSPSGSVDGGGAAPVTDPRADLDIDDQVGDGLTVVMEAVDTDLPVVHIAIETADGVLLGSDLRTEGRQPVTVRLDQPVPGSCPTTAMASLSLGSTGPSSMTRESRWPRTSTTCSSPTTCAMTDRRRSARLRILGWILVPAALVLVLSWIVARELLVRRP